MNKREMALAIIGMIKDGAKEEGRDIMIDLLEPNEFHNSLVIVVGTKHEGQWKYLNLEVKDDPNQKD